MGPVKAISLDSSSLSPAPSALYVKNDHEFDGDLYGAEDKEANDGESQGNNDPDPMSLHSIENVCTSNCEDKCAKRRWAGEELGLDGDESHVV